MQRYPLKGLKNFIQITRRPYSDSKSVFAFQRSNVDKANPHHSKDVVSWTIHISTLGRHASLSEMALLEASRMRNSGVEPNSYTLVCLIKASMNLGRISYGKQLHCYAIQSGFNSNVYIGTALISLYSKLKLLTDAHQVFVDIPHPNVVAWNSLICGFAQIGCFQDALCLVLELDRSDSSMDSFTFTAALTACAQLGLSYFGQTVHSRILKFGLDWNVVVWNCLIDMYGKCGCVHGAVQVFHEIINKDSVSWNSVIRASAGNQRLQESLSFLCQMPSPDTISYNEVIHGMSQFGNMGDAIRLLFQMPNPNSSSWNSVISGYVNRDQVIQALEFFAKMHSKGVEQDQFTYSTILKGVAIVSALTWGTLIHCCTIKLGLETSIIIGSALIDMYSKCGQVNGAELVFHSLPRRNLVSWNAMLAGYAHNGKASEVLRLFEQLKAVPGLDPDDITFLSVLLACAQDGHEGKLQQLGTKYFESMIKEYGIKPKVEHCTCMIGVLGRRGEVRRVKEMIEEMGFGSCGSAWRAFLISACCWGGDVVKVAEIAAAKVMVLEGGEDEMVHVQLSNLYALHGRWRDVSVVRRVMKGRGLRKEPGCSWIEIDNVRLASSIE